MNCTGVAVGNCVEFFVLNNPGPAKTAIILTKDTGVWTKIALYKLAAWLIPHCFPGPFPEFIRGVITKSDPHAGFFPLATKVFESICRKCKSAASHQTAFDEFSAIDMALSAHRSQFCSVSFKTLLLEGNRSILRIKSDKVPTVQSNSQNDLLSFNAIKMSKMAIPMTMEVGA